MLRLNKILMKMQEIASLIHFEAFDQIRTLDMIPKMIRRTTATATGTTTATAVMKAII